jgi:pectate lyase
MVSSTSFPGQLKLKQDTELMDGNFYDKSPNGNQITPPPAGTVFSFNPGASYDYTADSTDTARFIVDMCAGPGTL